MLFGYIKDFSLRYNYIDLETNKVFKSFDSDLKRVQWLRNLSLESLLIVSRQMKLEVVKVPWYENNFELVKLILPFFILYEFIGFFASLLFGLVFWIYYFLYRCKNENFLAKKEQKEIKKKNKKKDV